MKKLAFLLAGCLLITSCSNYETQTEAVDINDITFDTLRVNVLIFGCDTLTGTIEYNEDE